MGRRLGGRGELAASRALAVDAGMGARREVRASSFVNGKKNFASADGFWTTKDVHRIWPTYTVR